MRQIKFRGRVPDTDKIDGGKIVYGSLVIYATGMYSHWIYTEGAPRNYPVDPESVAQLIGIDANGREVYEGDTVIRIAGDEDFNPEKTFPMAAAFDDYAAIRDEEIVLVEAAK